ncbi:MAG: 16S rRNA (guanine(966)-N(2))-methyltransferase RsmD [Dehalococcoidia bacterium]
MRVIAGEAKGHRLLTPKGHDTRPTTDRVRGAIFSMLEAITSDWLRVLDLFAGTGALGIEALSRGAGWVDFVEQEPRSCSIIQQNLERTGLKDRGHVYCTSVRRALSFLGERYSILFMDPPYSHRGIGPLLDQVVASPAVGVGSTLVVPHSSRLVLSPSYGGFHLVRERRHGDTCVSIYREEGES